MRLNIEGIKPREEGLLLDAIERMGFTVGEFDGDDVEARRPDVMNLPEFKMCALMADTPFYAGVVWGRLQRLSMAGNPTIRSLKPPIRFMVGSWSACRPSFPNLLITDTLAPMVDWMEERGDELYDYFGVNPRMINVARRVSEVIESEVNRHS